MPLNIPPDSRLWGDLTDEERTGLNSLIHAIIVKAAAEGVIFERDAPSHTAIGHLVRGRLEARLADVQQELLESLGKENIMEVTAYHPSPASP